MYDPPSVDDLCKATVEGRRRFDLNAPPQDVHSVEGLNVLFSISLQNTWDDLPEVSGQTALVLLLTNGCRLAYPNAR